MLTEPKRTRLALRIRIRRGAVILIAFALATLMAGYLGGWDLP